MIRVRTLTIALALTLGLGLASLAASASAPRRAVHVSHGRGWPDGCPRAIRPVQAAPEVAAAEARAVRAQVPHAFAHLRSMGRPAWQHVQLLALATLGTDPTSGWLPRLRGFERYVRDATSACGARVAGNSTLVLLVFPECQLRCAPQYAYLTPTRRGWYLWTSYRV